MTAMLARRRVLHPISTAPFDPLALGWHTAFWADDPSQTNPGDGNAVSSWRDGSGNGHSFAQGSGANQPLFRASETTLNNHAALDCDGNNDFLATASFTSVPQGHSVVWIGKRKGVGGGGNERLVDLANGGSPFTSAFMRVSSGKWSTYAGSFADSTVSYDATVAHALRFKFNGASSAINADGTNTTTSPGSGAASYVCIGGYPAGATDCAAIKTGFVGFYAGDVTAAGSWSAFVTWVSTYYGLTIA